MELTINQALQQGVATHKEGKLKEAERFYRAILQSQPQHAEANHNLGVLAVSVNKAEVALPLFKTALEAKPSTAQFWLSYIDALIKLDRIAEAKAVLDQAKVKGVQGEGFDKLERQISEPRPNPQDPPPEQLQSIISLYNQGQPQKALSDVSQMLEKFPNSTALYNIAGACNAGLMKFDAAIVSYKKALKINPENAEVNNNMGNAFKSLGDLEKAVGSFKLAVKINPDYAEAYYNMGNTLHQMGDVESALVSYKKALQIKPDFAEAYVDMGLSLIHI